MGERPARPLGNLPTDGFEMLGKLTKTRGPSGGSAPVLLLTWAPLCPVDKSHPLNIQELVDSLLVLFSTCSLCWSFSQFALQSFEIVCNTTWASEDTCCDLPGVVSLFADTAFHQKRKTARNVAVTYSVF